MIGKNSLTKQMKGKEEEDCKYEVFEAIDYLVSAARELYCKEDSSFDEVISDLSKAILKLKGKEEELKKMGCKDEKEEENDDEE